MCGSCEPVRWPREQQKKEEVRVAKEGQAEQKPVAGR